MIHKPLSYLLDTASGGTFLLGIVTGQNIAIFLGGIASILAAVNHFQQIMERKQNKKNGKDNMERK